MKQASENIHIELCVLSPQSHLSQFIVGYYLSMCNLFGSLACLSEVETVDDKKPECLINSGKIADK